MVDSLVEIEGEMLGLTANLCKKTVKSAHNYRLNDFEYCEKERDANELLKPVKPFTILMLHPPVNENHPHFIYESKTIAYNVT